MFSRILQLILFSAFIGPVSGQIISDSLQIGKNTRTFHFFNGSGGAWGASLVFVLHGSGGEGLSIRKRALALENSAREEHLIVVYPDGYKRYWNECRKAAQSQANLEDVDENSFFTSMIAYFQKKYGADARKVFVVGTSGGGHMAYKLAMTMPGQIRAITALIASLPSDDNMDCVPLNKPLPVMIVNGTADPLNKYEGGEMKTADVYLGKVRSTDETVRYWAELAGYHEQPQKTILPDRDPDDGKTIEKYVYKKKKKPEIVLLKVINGKHDYPGDIDVHLEAWEFFKRQLKQ